MFWEKSARDLLQKAMSADWLRWAILQWNEEWKGGTDIEGGENTSCKNLEGKWRKLDWNLVVARRSLEGSQRKTFSFKRWKKQAYSNANRKKPEEERWKISWEYQKNEVVKERGRDATEDTLEYIWQDAKFG